MNNEEIYSKIEAKNTKMALQYQKERSKQMHDLLLFRLKEMNQSSSYGYVASGIIHDISAPLNTIKLNLQEVKNKSENIEIALLGVEEIESYIKTYASYLKNQQINHTINLAEDILYCVNLLQSKVLRENVQIKINITNPIKITANKSRFHQLILNLISNAIDAMKEQDNKLINITANNNEKTIEIKIDDNGPGILQSELNMIFEPLFTTKKSINNLGMGLYICKEIVERDLNGELLAQNKRESSGMSFTIKLPKLKKV